MRLGLIGAPGAGKDFIADYFVKEKGFKKFAFADQIKQEYYKITNISEKEFKSARGTDFEQKIRQELWKYSSKKTKNDKLYFISPVINMISNIQDPVIITDIRTISELEAVEMNNFQPILILRNYKEELKGEIKYGEKVIPGTKIPIFRVIEFPIFWNDSNDFSNLEQFYKEIRMDPDKPDDYSL